MKYVAVFLAVFSVAISGRAEAMLQLFNLSWNQVADKIPELAEAGYSSLWLPPPTKGGGGFSVGYDLFDPMDLGDRDQRGTVRTRYGTKEELQYMIRMAHRFGLRVYFDNIMNHRAFDIPGYNEFVPTNIYPGMVPGDFHLRTRSDGTFRAVSNIRDYNSVWQVQNLSLLGLVDIAHETPNANFGPTEGSTAPKPNLVRHPNNPEFYDLHPTSGRVGFGNVTQSVLDANPDFYKETVTAYLRRTIRYLIDQTRCDGLRLDAVKHVPASFFGQQSGSDKDASDDGYLGNAQLQFNLTHGFTDTNHRNSNFDTELTRNDALLFGEHLGEPPGFGEYVDAGMRLLDNPLRNHLNDVLGNPGRSLAGLEQRDAGGLAASVRVMHAQSHDNSYASRRELQNAYYFFREGVPLIYSDGYFKTPSSGGEPFPRHANAAYLGQFGDRTMPDLAWLHHQLARGGTRPRWGDTDIVAFERYDYREGSSGSPWNQTVILFVMNDNYGNPGDISFDDGVAQSDAGMPATCYPVENSRGVGLVVGFPPGSRLRQLTDGPGSNRACRELIVRYATPFLDKANFTKDNADPMQREVYVGGQAVPSGGGAVELKIPSGSYVAYAYQWPEASRVDGTLTNNLGEVRDSDVIVLQQGGRNVPRLVVEREDGPDGDTGFNPIYPFRMRGSVNIAGNTIGGSNVGSRTYAIDIPVVTNAGLLDVLIRTDGSATNALVKLDGGTDLNSQMNLGATNIFTQGLLDLRDNRPGTATDVFLGYEQSRWEFRYGPEKFAARLVARNTVRSPGAETYSFVAGTTLSNSVVNGDGFGNDYSSETCAWAYHDPGANNNVAGQTAVPQRSATLADVPVEIWVKVGYEFDIDRCYLYYTTDNTNPEGAYGTGQGSTLAVRGTFGGNDATSGDIDWWRITIPAQSAGVRVKYKMALHKRAARTISDFADAKRYALTQFAIRDWNPAQARVWLHNDLATNQSLLGLEEGFHILRARVFLPRDGKSSVYNTFLQTFYYDTQPPGGAIAFPPSNGSTLRSTEYGFVVRADNTTTDVDYNIIDNDPNNDDVVTGFRNGNGLSNGLPVFVRADLVTPTRSLDEQFPQWLREFRFNYQAVPSSGSATVTIRLKELSSETSPEHFRTLVRTVNAAAPAQTLTVAFPSQDRERVTVNQGFPYTIVVCFSDSLTAGIDLFSIMIDGALQLRLASNGVPAYRLEGSACGAGKRDLRFDWRNMSAGQHLIQVAYTGDGLSLQANRLVTVEVQGVTDTDGDGMSDSWEMQHGLSATDASGLNGADGDRDGDGYRNLEEYLAGTDPNDAQSLLKIVRQADGGRLVTWLSVPGKSYQLYATPDPTFEFEAVGPSVTAFGALTSALDSSPIEPQQFYRVRVLP